jgi:hypothetical protein
VLDALEVARVKYHVEKELADLFGGCTTVQADGLYDGLRERVYIVKSHCTDSDFCTKHREVERLAIEVRTHLNQRVVAVEEDGELLLI